MSNFAAIRSHLVQAVTDRYSAVDVAVAFGQLQNSAGKDIVKWQLGRTCASFTLLSLICKILADERTSEQWHRRAEHIPCSLHPASAPNANNETRECTGLSRFIYDHISGDFNEYAVVVGEAFPS